MHKPSIQQAGFYDWVQNGNGSCILQAVAGAGKTTTLINALGMMSGSIFFGAYNKKIAEEIASRATARPGLEITTMHSAGMRAWKKVARFPKVESNKVRNIFRVEVQRIDTDDLIFEGPVVHLVSLAKQAGIGIMCDVHFQPAWLDLIDHYNVEVFDEDTAVDNTLHIIEIAKHVFECSNRACREIIDFDDMIFAPLFFNVSFDKFDWVLIDEAQDTNPTRRELALRMLKPGTGRLVAVGDRHQAIYGFTGADANAIDLISEAVQAKQLPLTTTFRCPKAVVQYAQQWVTHIQAADTAPEGIVRYAAIEDLSKEVQVGDAILCRNTAPLVTHVYQLIAAGVPARIEGREIGAGLKLLVNHWKVRTIDQLIDKLETYREREVAKFTAKENMKSVEAVNDKVDCLRVIIARVLKNGTITQPPQLAVLAEIDAIFGVGDETRPVVLLSTIHKSKGREFHKVVWLQTGPSPYAKKDWEIQAEDNLCYVAATRAMHELVLMTVPKK